eukprot:PhF_6_TR10584/c0_g2_i1/m.16924
MSSSYERNCSVPDRTNTPLCTRRRRVVAMSATAIMMQEVTSILRSRCTCYSDTQPPRHPMKMTMMVLMMWSTPPPLPSQSTAPNGSSGKHTTHPHNHNQER